MHPDSLKALVIKLTYFSRDMAIKQHERDEAASMATNLANAAIKSYGRQGTLFLRGNFWWMAAGIEQSGKRVGSM